MGKEKVEDGELPQYGRFQTLRVLGEGGTSSVYLAKDPRLGRKVAIKVIKPDLGGFEGLLDRFATEARIVANLRHVNIVQVHDFEVQDDRHYLVMEYVEGPSLQSVLKTLDGDPIPPLVAANLINQAAEGLVVAHKHGLVHRDIKPDNLLLTADGTIKIADFGIAHIANLGVTNVGETLGTPHFMAPEQTHSDIPTAETDMWALGVVFYYCLTGRRPFTGATIPEIFRAIRQMEFEPVQKLLPNLDPALVNILDTLIQHAPEDRRNALWLSHQLKKYLDASGLTEWNEFTKTFLSSLKNPIQLQTVVELRQKTGLSASRRTTRSGSRNRLMRRLKPYLAMGAVAIASAVTVSSLFLLRGAGSNLPEGKVAVAGSSPPAEAAPDRKAALPLPPPEAVPAVASTPPPPAPSAAGKPATAVPAAAPVSAPAPPSPPAKVARPAAPKPAPERPVASDPARKAPAAAYPAPAVPLSQAPVSPAAPASPDPPPAPAAEPAVLNIISSPPNAKVFVNGKQAGLTLFNQKFEPGAYQVKISHWRFPNQDRDTLLHLKSGLTTLSFQFRN